MILESQELVDHTKSIYSTYLFVAHGPKIGSIKSHMESDEGWLMADKMGYMLTRVWMDVGLESTYVCVRKHVCVCVLRL